MSTWTPYTTLGRYVLFKLWGVCVCWAVVYVCSIYYYVRIRMLMRRFFVFFRVRSIISAPPVDLEF